MADLLKVKEKFICFHCGEECPDESVAINEKLFCCNGCKTVYEILNKSNLHSYYTIEQFPGATLKNQTDKSFDYLDDELTVEKLIDFKDENVSLVEFSIPQIHCSSCIWLLENLYKINPFILTSNVNFLKKTVSIKYKHDISLKGLVILLASIGYEPEIRLNSIEKISPDRTNKNLLYKLGLAAFCFGNIMLLSFPDYLSIDKNELFYRKLFGYLSMLLATPVLLYSSADYFKSAYKYLKKGAFNIDFPLSIGIFILYARSSYDVISFTGAGYFDSFSGLVFFLLIGKFVQSRTYDFLNFERNYKSYFPLGVIKKEKGIEKNVSIENLKIGDEIVIHNKEIIPADSILLSDYANIDFSFVTGEANPVKRIKGDLLYAGGRQIGSSIDCIVSKEVSQGYLTSLWNNSIFDKKDERDITIVSNKLSQYFTYILLAIAAAAFIFWLPAGLNKSFDVLTQVLIIACPCALALSVPFTLGNGLRILGKNKFYLKNLKIIQRIAQADTIVFDKTGTITKPGQLVKGYSGIELSDSEKEMTASLARCSTHPLSKGIVDFLSIRSNAQVYDFQEIEGKGLEGEVKGQKIKIGSAGFLNTISDNQNSSVFVMINGEVKGSFVFANNYRENISTMLKELQKKYDLYLLSGDNDSEKETLSKIFGESSRLKFFQSPSEKMEFIKNLQKEGKKVMMVGDGLNDSGALMQAEVGIAVTDNVGGYFPACDGLLPAINLERLAEYLKFSKTAMRLIILSYIISLLYNLFGLSFALNGLLTPIVAAILMPLSSISVISFASFTTNFFAGRQKL